MMNLAVNDAAYFQTKHEANMAIRKISRLLYDNKQKNHAYAEMYSSMISEFNNKPEKFKKKDAPKIPDGSPIGTDMCSYTN
jgi:hypothetical protein